jgi:hypothetical protein
MFGSVSSDDISSTLVSKVGFDNQLTLRVVYKAAVVENKQQEAVMRELDLLKSMSKTASFASCPCLPALKATYSDKANLYVLYENKLCCSVGEIMDSLGDEHTLQSIRVELSSEADLFFHYMHVIDEPGFLAIQEQQKLMVEFADYPNVLVRMLNACIKEPHSHLAVFVMKQDVDARLDFIQNMEYKFVELLSCHFIPSPEDVIRRQVHAQKIIGNLETMHD